MNHLMKPIERCTVYLRIRQPRIAFRQNLIFTE